MGTQLWNQEQAEETLQRFIHLTPRLQKNPLFRTGVYLSQTGAYVPFVYLKADEQEDGDKNLPPKYVYVVQVDDTYVVKMEGMVVLVGAGIPTKWLPNRALESDLDPLIQWVWDQWFIIGTALE
ncbi:hypothetical protein A3K34_02295 [candidate division WWE3 bacterium RIFOXYC1_FULL_40_10]|uniref:Uncharacterized protein n=1 Tax=candidate division WWE3 bacterium RIFOXYA2_FULL_46_9 TaxID=1802636 RepID=A0A1F4VYU2_UNCKA|nr:MAG: hypothetical protein A3K58_02295 [candidate division WWE3 bacterium RIFOXYB1_FULL_40_22]OGC61684.1 MAG: hypothetical protein A3K37_02295 [candidate division WWE3 bacterium RIFOXYA1_FULL_40_11]OGC62331.1 MAG: hypothetical protein A2264_02075 [candidate division WWE3 bacterium RIFOXYA2_FULL_46_9]OGC64859.1 MAG: hypothetical protein A2326_01120 [candidate division WWE3 bacterium RIFOXYB2_FULL_41_6]OGC66067.1 MAG: hypothetical protein A3K34_02295 [candidate division WWE3 bacterium RIFOXYC1_